MIEKPACLRIAIAIRGWTSRSTTVTWFGGLALTREDDGTTTLRAAVRDQAELHGLLTKVRDLGVTLISLTSIDAARDPDSQEQQHQ